MPCSAPYLEAWFNSPMGQVVIEQETAVLDTMLQKIFGYYLVQVGSIGGQKLTRASRIAHRSIIELAPRLSSQSNIDAIALAHQLPIASDSVDVVVLSHVLEFAEQPHQVLRETERVLIPEGRVIILGFNPFSLWGIRGLFFWKRKSPPWCGQFMHLLRMNDWLTLLGFELVEQHTLLYNPPCSYPKWFETLRFMEYIGHHWWPKWGGVYILHGIKRQSTLTPIYPRWLQPTLVHSTKVHSTN